MRQLALAAETPLDAASWHHDAGDVPAEVLLQSGPPWRKLDSEPVSIVAIRPNNSRSQNLSIGGPPHGSLQFGMRQRSEVNRARRRWPQSVETEPAADPPCTAHERLNYARLQWAVRQTSKPLVCRQCAIRFGRDFVSKS